MRRLIVALLAVAMFAGPASAADFRLLKIGGVLVKWGAPQLGEGATVSYGLAETAQDFPDAINCRSLVPASRLNIAAAPDFEDMVRRAFDLWQGATNVAFRRAAPGERPDILIGAQGTPESIAFANVWPDRGRAVAGVAPMRQATICLNPQLVWVPDAARRGQADFGTVLAHEIGHALGLDHPGPTGALMGYSDQGDIDSLMAGDLAGIAKLYGPARP